MCIRDRVRAFLELYRDLEEDRLTEEEQERIQQESPLETGFQPEIVLNGRKLRGVEGNGLCWLPESCREMDAGALDDGPAEGYPELDNDCLLYTSRSGRRSGSWSWRAWSL